MKKNIAYLNRTNVESGKLIGLVPELYELKNVIENSADGWHDQETVFNHTLSVMSALEKAILNYKGLDRILDKKIGENSRKILLKVAIIFHDIAKKETIIKDESGFTSCPEHAELGVKKTKSILERFDLSEKEKQFILDAIANHMHLHFLLVPDNPNFQKDFVNFKNKFLNYIYPELVLIAFADTVNSQLKKVNPKEFRYRIDFYKKEIEKLT